MLASHCAYAQSKGESPHSIDAVACPGFTVSSLERSVAFFTRVLTFRETAEHEVAGDAYEHLEGVFGLRMRVAHLELGDECLELTQYLVPQGAPVPQDSRSNDHWFQHIAIAVSDMNQAFGVLRRAKVQYASSEPERLPEWNKSAAGISAFYFKDPDGHTLELIQFPAGKGLSKWQASGPGLFLGIDHTAIVVSDVDRSLHFYAELLGMQLTGSSENYGPEQEHLNSVFGAHLAIRSLRATSGPGVELLQYLAPTDGRIAEREIKANDLLHWQTQMEVRHLDAFSDLLTETHVSMVSSGVLTFEHSDLGFTKALLVKDPDGHEVELIER